MQDDQRNSSRLPISPENEAVVARHGRVEFAAKLVNESAGGMELACEGQPAVGVGQRLQVQSYSGCYELEVVRAEISDDGMRLGLKRVCVLPELGALNGRSRSKAELWSAVSKDHSVRRVVAVGCLVLFGACLPSLAGLMRGDDGSGSGVDRLYVKAGAGPQESNFMLDTLNSLSSSSLTKELGLADSQQRSIEFIFHDVSQSLEGLYASKDKISQRKLKKESDRAVEKAVQRVVCTMTEEQVLKWRKVLANSPELNNR